MLSTDEKIECFLWEESFKYQNALKWLQWDSNEVQSIDSVYNAYVTWWETHS